MSAQDSTTSVIIDIQLGTADAKAKAIEITNQIIALKDKQDLLRSSGQALSVGYADISRQLSYLGQQQKAYLTLASNENTSNNAKAAQLKVVTAQLNQMSEAERTATAQGKALTEQGLKLKEDLNSAGESIGNTTGKVGSYESAIKSVIGQQIPYGNQLISLVQGTNSLGTAFGESAAAAAGFVAAGAAVVAGVVAIGDHFAELTPNANKLSQMFAGLKAAVRAFVDDLGQGVGFDKLAEDTNKAAAAARQLTADLQDLQRQEDVLSVQNAKLDSHIQELQLKLRGDAIKKDPKTEQEDFNKIQELSEQRYQLNKAVADKEYNLAVTTATNTERFSQREIDDLRKFGIDYAVQLDKNKGLVNGKDDLAAIAQAQIRQQDAERIKITTQERAQNRDAAFQNRMEAREKELAAHLAEIEKDKQKSAVLLAEQTMTIRQKEFTQIEADIDKRKVLYEKYGVDSTNLEKERLARIGALNQRFAKENQDALDKSLQKLNDLYTQNNKLGFNQPTAPGSLLYTKEDQKILQDTQTKLDAIAKEAEVIAARFAMGELDLAGQLDYLGQIAEQEQKLGESKFNANRVKETKDLDTTNAENLKQHIDANLATLQSDQDTQQKKLKLNEELDGSYASLANTIEVLAGKNSAVAKAAFAVEKGFAIAKIITNAELAKSEAFVAWQANLAKDAFTPIIGEFWAIGHTAEYFASLAAITTEEVAGVAAVAAQVVTSFIPGHARGGLISGPGTSTSDSIPARLSAGESVINAKSTKMFAPLLSEINEMGGGQPFATGGVVGGTFVPTLSNQVDSQNSIARSVVSGMQGFKIYASIEEIRYMNNRAQMNIDAGTF